MYQTHILRSRFRGAAASTSWSTLCRTKLHPHLLTMAPSLSRPSSGWSWSTTQTGSGPALKSLDRLAGRTCMITGGTSGIGFAIAERFLQEGAKHIILVGRSRERLVKAASKLEAPTSGNGSWNPFAFLQSSTDNVVRDVATKAPETDQLVKPASKLEAPASGYGLAFLQSRRDSIVREVATKAPETDQQSQNKDPAAKSHGTLIESSSRISLLIGDISEAGSWLRELEKAMVSSPAQSRMVLSNKSTATGRHPRQRRRHLHFEHPRQTRTRRYLPSPSHKSRGRNASLTSSDPRLDPQSDEGSQPLQHL
jgi:tRNA-splicing endonuclease subunit Sen54